MVLDSVMTKMHNYQSIQSLDLTLNGYTCSMSLAIHKFLDAPFYKGKRNIISQSCILVAASQEWNDLSNNYGDKNS